MHESDERSVYMMKNRRSRSLDAGERLRLRSGCAAFSYSICMPRCAVLWISWQMDAWVYARLTHSSSINTLFAKHSISQRPVNARSARIRQFILGACVQIALDTHLPRTYENRSTPLAYHEWKCCTPFAKPRTRLSHLL